MPTFTPPADVVQQLVELYRSSVPPDVAAQSRSLDEAWAIASILAMAESVVADWDRLVRISTAVGVALDALAADRGLRRQKSEGNESLRARLRVPPAAGTALSIVTAAQQTVDASLIALGFDLTKIQHQVFLIELPRDGIFLNRVRVGAYGRVSWRKCISRGGRISGGHVRMVLAIIPAAANAASAVTDILRTKVSAAKAYFVEEYTQI
jgi:hypothetical protein